MSNESRLKYLLDNCLEYISELKERETVEERVNFYKDIIGLNDEEIEQYSLVSE